MSLGIIIKGPEGLVLAADSRVTLEAHPVSGHPIPVYFDNATKLLSFSKPNFCVGAVTYGVAVIGLRTAHSYIPEFEVHLQKERGQTRLSILEFSQELSRFFMARWQEAVPVNYSGPDITFLVGGFDEDSAYGKVFLFEIPRQPDPKPQSENDFGMSWGGQLEVASRLINGYDPALLGILQQTLHPDTQQINQLIQDLRQLTLRVPFQVLPLQDCVDLAIFLIRTTIAAQSLSVGIRGVGGLIEVATITRTDGLKYVQQKQVHGEYDRRKGENP